jgi:FkbM family methyltransferase
MTILARVLNSARLMRRSRFRYLRSAMVHPPFVFYANGKRHRIAAGSDLGSGSCYSEVVIEDCYNLFGYAKRESPSLIVDIGANIGVFSKLCSALFPRAEIYAYEPNPRALTWLRENASQTRIRVIPMAVREVSGDVRLNTTCDSTIGRVSDNGNFRVRCVAASEVADGRTIDLLKIDCEGSEWSILHDATLLRRSRELCLEYHLFDGHTVEEVKELIARSGHRIVSMGNTKDGGKFGVIRSVLQSSSAESDMHPSLSINTV